MWAKLEEYNAKIAIYNAQIQAMTAQAAAYAHEHFFTLSRRRHKGSISTRFQKRSSPISSASSSGVMKCWLVAHGSR